jgi:hypothetical protein
MPIQTGRNPFARETIFKRQREGSCLYCGGTNKKGKVWKYFVESDRMNNSTNPIHGKFCGIQCLNSYHSF